MEAIFASAATTGAALLQADVRTADVPMTPSVVDLLRDYFDNDLHVGGIRAVEACRCFYSGLNVVRDQDMFQVNSAAPASVSRT
jgi:hypothetical protein